MTNEQLKRILFVDIETVPVVHHFSDLNENMQSLWTRKARLLRSDTPEDAEPAKLFTDRGGIFSEFSKVVCIGIGSIIEHEQTWKIRLKSISNDDEKVLLNNFSDIIRRFSGIYKDMRFSGHNIREFDLPFLCRRMIINGIALQEPLQLGSRKPWENPHVDTLELWKFGDYKHYTSLALLAEVLGIPSPKNDMEGSMVSKVYWEDHNLARIADYCLQDVLTSCRVLLHLSGRKDLDPVPLYLKEEDS